jgi:hypothetical protein
LCQVIAHWAWHVNHMLKPLGGHPQLPQLPMRWIFLASYCTINHCVCAGEASRAASAQ